MTTEGIITIRPISANLLRDTDTFGKIDPYLVINVGTKKFVGKVVENGGLQPQFSGETFETHIADVSSFKATVWDSDPGKDDFVAEGDVDFSQAISNGNATIEADLFYKSDHAGQIKLEIGFKAL